MPRFSELDEPFVCPYRHGCPCLEGLPPDMVWQRYQAVQGTECQYEHLLRELHGQLDQEQRRNRELETENQQLKVQLRALHQRQFKGRTHPPKDPPKPDAGRPGCLEETARRSPRPSGLAAARARSCGSGRGRGHAVLRAAVPSQKAPF